MKIKPKEVLINVPVVLLFSSEDEAARFASGINTIIHGKVKLKYDNLGALSNQEVVIFYLQRNDEYHHLRNQFVQMIEQEEMGIVPVESEDDEENVASVIEDTSYLEDEDTKQMLLSKEQMLKLPTKRLLAYKKKLLSYNENSNADWDDDDTVITKASPEWQRAYKDIKEILATREHVEK